MFILLRNSALSERKIQELKVEKDVMAMSTVNRQDLMELKNLFYSKENCGWSKEDVPRMGDKLCQLHLRYRISA